MNVNRPDPPLSAPGGYLAAVHSRTALPCCARLARSLSRQCRCGTMAARSLAAGGRLIALDAEHVDV